MQQNPHISNSLVKTATACLLSAFLMAGCTFNTHSAKPTTTESDVYEYYLEKSSGVFHPYVFTLDNGLTGIVVENTMAPVVSHMIWYKVGSADDTGGQSGLAHYLEHLMFKGTETVGDGEFTKIVARNGGMDNAFTSWDYTAYFQQVPCKLLPDMMRLEADRMVNLKIDPESAETERKVVIEERKQRTDNNAEAQFQERLAMVRQPNHPYGRPIIGWPADMEGFDSIKAKAFYKKWYAPNNAILVVSGDVKGGEVEKLAREIYGKIPSSPVPERKRTLDAIADKGAPAPEPFEFRHDSIQQPLLQLSLLLPPKQAYTDPLDSVSLEVFAAILGQGSTSRLYRQLVVGNEKTAAIATAVSANYMGTRLDQGLFSIALSPVSIAGQTPEASIQSLENALEPIWLEATKNGVTDTEVRDVIKRLSAESTFARDSLSSSGYAFGMALTTGGSVSEVESWPARLSAVTPETVKAAVDKYLNGRPFLVARMLPAATK